MRTSSQRAVVVSETPVLDRLLRPLTTPLEYRISIKYQRFSGFLRVPYPIDWKSSAVVDRTVPRQFPTRANCVCATWRCCKFLRLQAGSKSEKQAGASCCSTGISLIVFIGVNGSASWTAVILSRYNVSKREIPHIPVILS